VTSVIAPKPSADVAPAEPIIVVGCLRSATGLGQSARLCLEALRTAGLNVYGIDVSALLMQPVNLPGFEFRDGRSVRGRGSLLIHVSAPFLPLVLSKLGRQLVRDKWIVGYWAWELPAIPDEWMVGAAFVHEIWVPSRFVATAVATRLSAVPTRVLHHPVAQAGAERFGLRRRKAAPFTVLCVFDMGSSFARKNPIAAIAAFQNAFGDDPAARMIVKVMNAASYPDGRRSLYAAANGAANIAVEERTLARDELANLYGEADCLISLHRSEGFGLTVAEAMLHALPVLSTDWSGTTDFVTAATGLPIGYRLIPASDAQRSYDFPDQVWADADTSEAAKKLIEIRESDTNGLGEKAREYMLRNFNNQVYADAACRHLNLSR